MWYRWGEKTLGKFKSVIEWIFVPLPVYGIAGFEGTRSRAEETFISVLARKHSFHWADSWEMPLQVLAIHKTYRSAKSIKKLGCVPTSGLWIQWSSIHAFGFFDQPFQSCCYRLILATVFYNTLTWFCALLLRFGIHVPNANSQKSERSFFFQISSHSFAKHQLCSINHVFKFNQCCYTTLHPKSARPGVAM